MTTTQPSLFDAVLEDDADGATDTICELSVAHSPGCRLMAGDGPCNCSPRVAAGVVLWRRTSRRGKWREAGRFPTEAAALGAMKGSCDWLTLPTGRKP